MASGYTPEGRKWSPLPVELFKVVVSKYWESIPMNCCPTNNDSLLLYGNNISLAEMEKMHLHFTNRIKEAEGILMD